MTEPQIWTIIGVFAATLVAMVTIVMQSFHRSIDGLRTEMVLRFEHFGARFDGLEGRMDRLEGRMDRLEGRIDRIEKRVDDIDRDVQAISKRIFPE
ncbi:MAG: hypothetical protein ACK5LO_00020 [Leucobacter sp.]